MQRVRAGSALVATVVLAAVGVLFITPSAGAAIAPQTALAVRGQFDSIAQGSAVTATINYKGEDGRNYLRFTGATTAAGQAQVVIREDQIETVTLGDHPISRRGTPGTIGVVDCGYTTEFTGTMRVLSRAVFNPNGTLNSFAADLTENCYLDPPRYVQLRYAAPVGWSQLMPTSVPPDSSVDLGSYLDGTVTYTAYGTQTIHPGNATIASVGPAGDPEPPNWHLTYDHCVGETLNPGQLCQLGVRLAPTVSAFGYARLSVPDGRPSPAVAGFHSSITVPDHTQFPPVVTGHFHRLHLEWREPTGPHQAVDHYDVYELRSGGAMLVTSLNDTSLDLPGLPTGYTARFQVRVVYQNATTGPLSAPSAPATTSSQELVYATPGDVKARRLDEPGTTQTLFNAGPAAKVSVAADQQWLAFDDRQYWQVPSPSRIYAGPIDDPTHLNLIGSTPDEIVWDATPTVAPDSSAVIFVESASETDTATVLRRWDRSSGQTTDVAGSSGLTRPAYTADGAAVIAVAHDGNATQLVRLDLSTGERTDIAGTDAADEPAVAADGRIAYVDRSAAPYSELKLIPADGGAPSTVTGPPHASNVEPSFDPTGTKLVYSSGEVIDGTALIGYAHAVTLTSGVDTAITSSPPATETSPVIVAETPPVPAPVVGPESASTFVPSSPAVRLLDTRNGTGAAKAPVGPAGTITLDTAPASLRGPADATAVLLNVTTTNSTAGGYLTVYPHGQSRPGTSNLNLVRGQTSANLVVVPVGQARSVDIYNAFGSTDVIADLAGWYVPRYGDVFTPAGPTRVLDTRTGTFRRSVGARQSIGLFVNGVYGVPLAATAVVLNVTVTNATASSYLTVYPDGSPRPATSNLNFSPHQTVANLVVVPLDGGMLDLYNASGTVDVVADVFGWYAPTRGGPFVSNQPRRVLDTRAAVGVAQAKPVPAQGSVTLDLTGVLPPGATAAVFTVTGTNATASTFITVYPHGQARPTTSSVNLTAGRTVPNLVVVPVTDGKVVFYNGLGSLDIIADLLGYYTG